MKNLQNPKIKVCCIGGLDEATTAVRLGASAIGLVSQMPSGPGVIDETLIRSIAQQTPPPIATFLLTSQLRAAEIIAQQRRCLVNAIQICDRLPEGTHQELREALPGVKLVQVVHVTGESSVDEALQVAPHVEALLLDSGNPCLAVKELGGTGRVHDWTISRRICEQADKPVFLAGGLNAENVQQAVETVRPFGVDVCSGVRTNGRLDPIKLQEFVAAVDQTSR